MEFNQLDMGRPGQRRGVGLGLAIVSDIIVAYEGNIQLERGHLGGASFIIELPRH